MDLPRGAVQVTHIVGYFRATGIPRDTRYELVRRQGFDEPPRDTPESRYDVHLGLKLFHPHTEGDPRAVRRPLGPSMVARKSFAQAERPSASDLGRLDQAGGLSRLLARPSKSKSPRTRNSRRELLLDSPVTLP